MFIMTVANDTNIAKLDAPSVPTAERPYPDKPTIANDRKICKYRSGRMMGGTATMWSVFGSISFVMIGICLCGGPNFSDT